MSDILAYIKGDVGEVITASALRERCDMKVVRNLYMIKDDHLTEIDMIGLSKSGMFIVENKNYSGSIWGSAESEYWKVKYPYGSCSLYNPIKQNETHKRVVLNCLSSSGFDEVPIFKPVIFNDKASLHIKGADRDVFTLSSFVEAYKGINYEVLTEEYINKLYKFFMRFSNQSYEAKMIHKILLYESR